MTNKSNMLTKWEWDRKVPIGPVIAMILQIRLSAVRELRDKTFLEDCILGHNTIKKS